VREAELSGTSTPTSTTDVATNTFAHAACVSVCVSVAAAALVAKAAMAASFSSEDIFPCSKAVLPGKRVANWAWRSTTDTPGDEGSGWRVGATQNTLLSTEGREGGEDEVL